MSAHGFTPRQITLIADALRTSAYRGPYDGTTSSQELNDLADLLDTTRHLVAYDFIPGEPPL
jgi:hypothetical protein